MDRLPSRAGGDRGTVMKSTSFCVLAALSALALAGAVRAESEAEYANPAPGSGFRQPSLDRSAEPAKPKPRIAPRPALFAPAAAANAMRMAPQEREERHFLKEAAATSRFEAEAARIALGKSNDAGVRSIAATLINHHASANNELLHMLHARGMAAPMLANDQRKILNRLAKMQGARFDRGFLEDVALKSQQGDVQLYEKASLAARDPRLKAWIDRTLPTLRYQLATAERLASADMRLARAAGTPQAATSERFVSRASMATRSMGAAPAPSAGAAAGGMQFGGLEFGGSAQLGVTRPVAARPTESSNR
jgi:predicted outer membrane protein